MILQLSYLIRWLKRDIDWMMSLDPFSAVVVPSFSKTLIMQVVQKREISAMLSAYSSDVRSVLLLNLFYLRGNWL